jgi:hypothetical protein
MKDPSKTQQTSHQPHSKTTLACVIAEGSSLRGTHVGTARDDFICNTAARSECRSRPVSAAPPSEERGGFVIRRGAVSCKRWSAAREYQSAKNAHVHGPCIDSRNKVGKTKWTNQVKSREMFESKCLLMKSLLFHTPTNYCPSLCRLKEISY